MEPDDKMSETLTSLLGSRLEMNPYVVLRQMQNGYLIHYWGPEGSKNYVARTMNEVKYILFRQLMPGPMTRSVPKQYSEATPYKP